jgi:hypothetical protein
MSVVGGGFVMASGVQGGHADAPGYETLVIVALVAAMTVACVLIASYLRRRQRRTAPVADQWQALAVMGELCPHGWQAQVTVYGGEAPLPSDAPASRIPLVELEWKQFDARSGEVAVARRAWAPSIGEALQTMVDARQTDIALEQIERTAAEDGGARWSD